MRRVAELTEHGQIQSLGTLQIYSTILSVMQ